MSSLTERVCRTIDRYRLLPPGARVLVAASGGADSTALVCLLRELAAGLGIELVGLAHFNHMLRGAAADDDERFCREMAGRFALAFDAGRGDVGAAARRWGASIEDAGRRLRYQFLEEARARAGATHVAVGHTRDDQAETVLLNLLRGAGTLGLGGMPVRRGTLVRPLIDCRHQELVDYLAAAGVPFREDESNLDRRHLRNRIRHEVLPALESVQPSAGTALARAAATARADAEYLDELAAAALTRVLGDQTEKTLTLDVEALVGLPMALARRVAGLALRQASGGRFVGFDQAERLLALALGQRRGPMAFPGVQASLAEPGGLVLVSIVGRGVPPEQNLRLPRTFFRSSLSIPGEVVIGDRVTLSSELRPGGLGTVGLGAPESDLLRAVIDAELVSDLAVRFRRPGDRFRPLGLLGSKKVQDFFVDRKVPRRERDLIPLVVDGHDRIVWIAGYAISEDFRVSERTRTVVILTVRGERG
jgi:tRNA(Ile)-lysidine synthase